MKIVTTLEQLYQALAPYQHPSFVPTMGNLHRGHIALVEQARTFGDVCVSSIFVNRLQFGPNEDFDRYPRTFEEDCQQLEKAGCNLLFAPTEEVLYPQKQTFIATPPDELTQMLEGHFRPGFFHGVSTVVLKLFSCVFSQAKGERFAVFGKKDYQQLMIIRQMVQQFALPITVIAGETQRAQDGLALSSRNNYLTEQERQEAVHLSFALKALAHSYASSPKTELARLEQEAMAALNARGWLCDYLTVRKCTDLKAPEPFFNENPLDLPLVVLGAAKLGKTRLIDNFELNCLKK